MSAATQTETTASAAAEKILSVNNIEVVYDHVILVLKGVSLEVRGAGSSPCSAPMAPAKPPP